MRTRTLPDRLTGETDVVWCRRAAESIPAEELMAAVVAYLDRRETRRRGLTWRVIEKITGHGSSVSAAIVDRFRRGGGA